eukprot:c2559_g1_i1.p1 GENE.c2559_g1_i1~~c2559_g1_i1.p1  ORF type:complete len:333 (-),score=23.17 c2559_g1_i1:18-1016(-)
MLFVGLFVVVAHAHALQPTATNLESTNPYRSALIAIPKSLAPCTRNCGGPTHGKCVNGACVCTTSWTGSDCSKEACPGNCNMHGVCNLGICACYAGFKGDACEIGTKVSKFNDVPIGNPKVLVVDQTKSVVRIPSKRSGDGPKLVYANITATTSIECLAINNFSFAKIKPIRKFSSQIPGNNVIEMTPRKCAKFEVITKYGEDVFRDVLVSEEPRTEDLNPEENQAPEPVTCANNCSGHGECRDGFCYCQESWFGPCCCRQEGEPGPNHVDPLAHEPGFPAFFSGRQPLPTDHVSVTHSFGDGASAPTAPTADTLLEISSGIWETEDFFCCE